MGRGSGGGWVARLADRQGQGGLGIRWLPIAKPKEGLAEMQAALDHAERVVGAAAQRRRSDLIAAVEFLMQSAALRVRADVCDDWTEERPFDQARRPAR